MLFYTINDVVLLVWAAIFCFYKPSKVKNLIFVILSFTQLFVLMAFRTGIGFDYEMYVTGFNNMNSTGFSSLVYKDWETGFIVLTKLIGMTGLNADWYILILSLIAIVPAALFIYKHSVMPWVSTLLYVNLFLFFMSMNFLRQMIALSLLMLAWHFMKNNKFLFFAAIILFASLFHQTVLIMIPVYVLVKVKPGIKELLLYGYLLLWFYLASTNLIELITTIFHEEYSDSIFIKQGVSLIYAILPLFITVVSFLLVKTETINITNENKYLINLSFIGSIMMLTMAKHSIIERLSYYFLIFTILLVPVIFQSLRAKGIRYQFASGRTINLTSEKTRTALAITFLLLTFALSFVHFYFGLGENAHGAANYQFHMISF